MSSPDRTPPIAADDARTDGSAGRGALRDGWTWFFLVLPVVVWAVDGRWPLPSQEGLDRWFYTGFIVDAGARFDAHGESYYGARVGAWLPAAVLHRVLPDDAAAVGARWLRFWAVVLPVFLALRAAGMRRAGVVAGVLLIGQGGFHTDLAEDYVVGPGTAWLCICWWCAVRSADSRRAEVWHLAAGAAFAAAVAGNLFLTAAGPSLAAGFALRSGGPMTRGFWQAGATALAGAAAMLAALGAAYRMLGSPGGDVLWPQWWMLTASLGDGSAYRPKDPLWWREAWWLLPMLTGAVSVLAAAFASALSRTVSNEARRALPTAVVFAGLAATWTAVHLRGQPILAMPFYVSYLVPSAMAAVAACGAPLWRAMSTAAFIVVMLAATGAGLAGALGWVGLTDVVDGGRLLPHRVVRWAALLGGGGAVLAGAAVVVPWLRTRFGMSDAAAAEEPDPAPIPSRGPGVVASLSGVAALVLLTLSAGVAAHFHESARRDLDVGAPRRECYRASLALARGLGDLQRRVGRYRLWYDAAEQDAAGTFTGRTFRTGCASMSWGPALLSERFPLPEREPGGPPIPWPAGVSRIVVMSSRADAEAEAVTVLRGRGLAVRVIERGRFDSPPVGAVLVVLEVVAPQRR